MIQFVIKFLTQIFIITGNLEPIRLNLYLIFIAKYASEPIVNINYNILILHGMVKKSQVLKQHIN